MRIYAHIIYIVDITIHVRSGYWFEAVCVGDVLLHQCSAYLTRTGRRARCSNPPAVVAEVFADLLQGEFAGAFGVAAFAVPTAYGRHNFEVTCPGPAMLSGGLRAGVRSAGS